MSLDRCFLPDWAHPRVPSPLQKARAKVRLLEVAEMCEAIGMRHEAGWLQAVANDPHKQFFDTFTQMAFADMYSGGLGEGKPLRPIRAWAYAIAAVEAGEV